MLKRLIDGMRAFAPDTSHGTGRADFGGEAGGKGRVRETEGGAIGNVNPGELSDRIEPMPEGGGGGPVIEHRGHNLIEGGGVSDVTPVPDQGGSAGSGSGGTQTDGAGGPSRPL